MRAAVVDRYGSPDVVHITDVPQPTPGADQVLVRIKAVAVTTADARIRAARFPPGFAVFARLIFGVLRPRRTVLGNCISGTAEAVGSQVIGITPGDEVCGMTGAKMGAHAEYAVVPARKLTHKPPEVSHEDAAGVLFGGTTALFFLRDKAKVEPGQSVLVNGASGAIGTNAVQLANHQGAEVTGVTSTANTSLVSDLGAATVIDYTTENLDDIDSRFDVVLDTVGNLSIAGGRRLLKPTGLLALAVASLGENIRARGNVVAGVSPDRVEDFEYLLGLVADGVIRVVLDEVYDLDDIADAHRRVDSGHKVGNIVVRP